MQNENLDAAPEEGASGSAPDSTPAGGKQDGTAGAEMPATLPTSKEDTTTESDLPAEESSELPEGSAAPVKGGNGSVKPTDAGKTVKATPADKNTPADQSASDEASADGPSATETTDNLGNSAPAQAAAEASTPVAEKTAPAPEATTAGDSPSAEQNNTDSTNEDSASETVTEASAPANTNNDAVVDATKQEATPAKTVAAETKQPAGSSLTTAVATGAATTQTSSNTGSNGSKTTQTTSVTTSTAAPTTQITSVSTTSAPKGAKDTATNATLTLNNNEKAGSTNQSTSVTKQQLSKTDPKLRTKVIISKLPAKNLRVNYVHNDFLGTRFPKLVLPRAKAIAVTVANKAGTGSTQGGIYVKQSKLILGKNGGIVSKGQTAGKLVSASIFANFNKLLQFAKTRGYKGEIRPFKAGCKPSFEYKPFRGRMKNVFYLNRSHCDCYEGLRK